ncbi:hypothetical protein FB451DRAFT_999090, partial [Mycena latifolia]
VAVPWQQITKFAGEMCSVQECIEVLRLAPNLVKRTFSGPSAESYARPQLLVHPTLQSLGLFADPDGDTTADILKFVTLPALERLDIAAVPDLDDEEYVRFLTRSSAKLRRLPFR